MSASATFRLFLGRQTAIGEQVQFIDDRRGAKLLLASAATRPRIGGQFLLNSDRVHQVKSLNNRGVARPFTRGILVRVGPTEGVEKERGDAVGPNRESAAARGSGVE